MRILPFLMGILFALPVYAGNCDMGLMQCLVYSPKEDHGLCYSLAADCREQGNVALRQQRAAPDANLGGLSHDALLEDDNSMASVLERSKARVAHATERRTR